MPETRGIRASLAVAILVLSVWFVPIAIAQVRFDVPAQPLAEALKQIAVQAGINIYFDPPAVRGLTAPQLKAQLTPEDALARLLIGTPLRAVRVDEHTFRVVAIKEIADPSNGSRAGATSGRSHPDKPANGAAPPGARAERGSDRYHATLYLPVTLGEVIVTAQKRDEPLQDVPVPVTVLSPQALVEGNQLRLQDYASSVPGFNVTPRTASTQSLTLRGVTTGGSSNPTVGIMIDGVPFGASTNLGGGGVVPDIDPGDLARIEILRGPQGTLYGASSLGGLINYVTVDPSMRSVSGRVEVGGSGVSNGNGLGYDVRGAANIPLINTVAARVSGFIRQEPGFIDNPVLNDFGVNKQQVTGTRLATLWRPSDPVSLKLSALYQDYKGDGNNDVDLLPNLSGLQQNYIARTGEFDRKLQAYSAILKATLGSVELTSLSGYNVNSLTDSLDYSSIYGPTTQKQFGVAGASLTYNIAARKLTQEVRLSSHLGERVEWLAGGYYSHEKSTYSQSILAENPTTGALAGTIPIGAFPTTLADYAGFADVTYYFTDRLDVQVGARESHITQSATTPPNPTLDTTANAFTYLFTPRLKISRDLMVYARLASGYRPGGSNVAYLVDPTVPKEYNPDKTENYELGLKGDFLERRLFVDASVYYITWHDIQIPLLSALHLNYNGNGGQAKSQGAELSVNAKPLQGLTMSAWVAFDDAVLTQNFPPKPVYGHSGDRLPNSSRFSGNFSADYEFPVGRATAFVGGTVAYIGDRIGVFGSTPTRAFYPSYSKIDLRCGVSFDRSTTLNLFVSNLADKRGILGGGPGYTPAYAYQYLRPRTIGLSIVKTF